MQPQAILERFGIVMAKTNIPVISVVIQTKQTPPMILKRCIQCIREQTYPQIEIILLDSNDDDSRYKESIKEDKELLENIIHLEIPEGGEFVEGKNTALKTFHGDYITFISAQDVMPACRLEEIITIMEENHSYNTVYTDMSIQQSNVLEISDFSLISKNFEYLPQLVFHREAFQWIGEFDCDLVAHCDDDIWFRLNSLHLPHHVSSPETTVYVCPDCYNDYPALESAIGCRQLMVKYDSLFQRNKKMKKRHYKKIAEEYKKARVLHRHIQFWAKAFFTKK